MKKKWKTKWLAALRGPYKQTDGTLRRVNRPSKKKATFCCLGVLCDIAGVKWEGNSACLFGSGNLNNDGLQFFGITNRQQNTLVSMNDMEGKSFAEIADYVEKNL